MLRWLTGEEPQVPKGLRRRPEVTGPAAGAEGLAVSLLEYRARIPFATAQAGFHQLSSHDTPRLITALDGDRRLFRLAVFLQFTWPGLPCVYYGDEIGLEGGRDPENRRAMAWNEAVWDREVRQWHCRLIALRRDDPVLAGGGVLVLHAVGDVFCFARLLGNACRLAALNRGLEPVTVTLNVGALGWQSGTATDQLADGGAEFADGSLTLELEPGGVRLLRSDDEP